MGKKKTPNARPNAGKPTISELSEQAQKALALLESETADAIIGEQSEEYGTLIQGTNAVMGMAWAGGRRWLTSVRSKT